MIRNDKSHQIQVIRMIQCSDEAGPIGWTPQYPACWWNTDLLDYNIRLDTYTKDVETNYGPTNHPWTNWDDYFARWRERRPTPSRLIQLAFHDCLRYKKRSNRVRNKIKNFLLRKSE